MIKTRFNWRFFRSDPNFCHVGIEFMHLLLKVETDFLISRGHISRSALAKSFLNKAKSNKAGDRRFYDIFILIKKIA